ncbi:MAG: redoxin domain-containing protein [Bacteroidia bacterium]
MRLYCGWLAVHATLCLAQPIPSYYWTEVESRFSRRPDTLYVLNFWSTWCRPCVTELPLLQAAYETLRVQLPVQIWLISLDFPPDGAQKAYQLLKQKRIHLPALWLNESDPNRWIPRIDPTWDGAIPYTKAWNVPVKHTADFSSVEEVMAFVKAAYDALKRTDRR